MRKTLEGDYHVYGAFTCSTIKSTVQFQLP